MPPVPVYTDAPISAAKASDAEPQTSPPTAQSSNQPSNNTASNTTATSTSSYPPAAPGAAPAPAPTGSLSSTAPEVHGLNPQPAPTRTISANSDPPPPQPGAVPQPGNVPVTTAAANAPAAPQPGQAPSTTSAQPMITPAPSTTTAAPQGPPSQFNIPAPIANAAPTRSTEPATTLSYGGHYGENSGPPPAVLSAGARGGAQINPEAPPGYVQSTNVDVGSAAGIQEGTAEEGGIWDTAKKWAGEAGKGLQNLEAEAWKRVGGK
ncbi:MAG: hypothetical protein M1820_004028 [Bogoriella megaspora]|nr:MAG: hypothetical protein M1820_004028 [Bogoriella megaspora]